MPNTDWAAIARGITEASGTAFDPGPAQDIAGGCINRAVRLSDGRHSWFVKINRAHRVDMFEAEYAGLQAIAGSHSLRVPEPLCTGISGDDCYLVMEYIALSNNSGKHGQGLAGEYLAAMHRHNAPTHGWERDNTIGETTQLNPWCSDWVSFWREQRLGFQLELAASKGFGGRLQQLGQRLLERLDTLIDHAPTASLLHGDLWGGNLSYTANGEPLVYDPATYYGDRETDLAMTELFGGFGRDFYDAYESHWPLDAGYTTRKTLYNLYHILNHLNLFGGGYANQAQGMIEALLAETG